MCSKTFAISELFIWRTPGPRSRLLADPFEERGLVDHRNLELGGLLELGARARARHHQGHALRDPARDLRAGSLGLLLRFRAAHGVEAAGEHHRLAGERLRAFGL